MSRAPAPFSPRALLAIILAGIGAFGLFLYAIGAGWDGSDDRDGGAHAAANGLNGFAGLARLLAAQGHPVALSRSEARLDDPALLVLTPPLLADGERLDEIIAARRYHGPTLVILPKWFAMEASQLRSTTTKRGWVVLAGSGAPEWLKDVEGLEEARPLIAERKRWEGLGLEGSLPDPASALALAAASLETEEWTSMLPLVTDETGDVLAGYLNDEGSYPLLDEASGYITGDDADEDLWPLVIVAEPDLMNNYGLADRTRAELAHALVDATLGENDLPIVFDLTLPGLGRSENLLTLAFEPPFLAATLCLALAALLVGWRAFRRFGPAVAEAPALAAGKRQLAANSGALVERTRRIHLLGAPYAALVAARIARKLGLRESQPELRDRHAAELLAARAIATDYPARLAALREARHTSDLLRAAGALTAIERTLTP